MKKFTLFIFSFVTLSVCAQNWDWARQATLTSAKQDSKKVIADAFGNVFLLGTTQGYTEFGSSQVDSGTFIAKYTSNGTSLWAKNISASVSDFSLDAIGNVYLTGNFNGSINISNTNLTSKGGTDFYFLKLDNNGNTILVNSFGGKGNDGANAITSEPSGNSYLTGYFQDTISLGSYTITDTVTWGIHFFMTKLTTNGNVTWADKGLSYCTSGELICVDKKNTIYVIAQYQYPYAYGDGKVIIEYDTLGNTKYSKEACGTTTPIWGLTVDDSLNIYVISSWGSHYGDWPEIEKYNSLMQLKWSKHLGTGSDGYYLTNGLSVDSIGSIYVAGNLYRHSGAGNDSVFFANQWIHIKGDVEAVIAKLNSSGDYSWYKVFGGLGTESPSDMCLDRNGQLYVTGNYHSSNSPPYETVVFGNDTLKNDGIWQQIFIAKLSSVNVTSGVQSLFEIISDVNIYPNPSSGIFTVRMDICQAGAKITVRDVLGNCLLERSCRGETGQEINLSCQPRGIYFVELLSGDEKVVKKVAVQ